MRRSWICVGLLALCACDRSVYSGWSSTKTAERADIADANARNALAKIAALTSDLETAKATSDDLEVRLNRQSDQIEYLLKAVETLDKNEIKLFDNDGKLQDRIDGLTGYRR